MGMNFKVDLFDATWGFYAVVAAVAAIAALTIGVAKTRRWI
jgi:Mg2+ and Co2+ transporter CorA